MAQREIGLAAGEPPTTRGYPPSVFGLLPKLVERAGRAAKGSITGFYSVLVEGDDPQEPISDAVRGLLDGHTWLSRKLAARAHYTAIDVLDSISRLASDITPRPQQDAAQAVRELLAAYRDHEDLISIGAYRRGANRTVDAAIDLQDEINRYLRQRIDERVTLAEAAAGLSALRDRAATHAQSSATAGPSPAAPPLPSNN
jgi:flagellar biosynthesis/type III secretory pathway ATPase